MQLAPAYSLDEKEISFLFKGNKKGDFMHADIRPTGDLHN
jgi:hypothetical protein